jgi:hypothetical protein
MHLKRLYRSASLRRFQWRLHGASWTLLPVVFAAFVVVLAAIMSTRIPSIIIDGVHLIVVVMLVKNQLPLSTA